MLAPPTLGDVLTVVAAATTIRSVAEGDLFARSKRTAPSAGALHPISVVIVRPGPPALPLRVDPASPGFQALSVVNRTAMCNQMRHLNAVVPSGQPTYIVLLGDIRLVEAAYVNPNSLLWRDAGALLATLHLCAANLGLGFCPLGLLGESFKSAIFPEVDHMIACGTAAIGVPSCAISDLA